MEDSEERVRPNDNSIKLSRQKLLLEALNISDSGKGESETSEENSSLSEKRDELEKLELYCIALDDMLDIGKKFIDAQNEVSSLKMLRRQLSISNNNSNNNGTTTTDRYAVIEDNVPEELKCPVCFEIFESEVLQCKNGHSICSRCCHSLTECPECRESYKCGKIRNRTIEKLMSNMKIDCLYNGAGCRERLICATMQVHVETCEFMNKPVRSPEYKEVKRQLRSRDGDLKRLEKRMEEANKRLIKAKAVWYKARGEFCSLNIESQLSTSMEELIRDFQLEEKEKDMLSIYLNLSELMVIQK